MVKIDHVSNRNIVIEWITKELFGPSPSGKELEITNEVKFESFPDSYGPWIEKSTGEEILDLDTPVKRYGVGILFPVGYHAFECTQCQVSVTDLTPAGSTDRLGLAG